MPNSDFLKTVKFLAIASLIIVSFLLLLWAVKNSFEKGKVFGEATATEEVNCEPKKEFLGATDPDFDCREGSAATVMIKACIPEDCPLKGATVTFDKSVTFCPGSSLANCGGACGSPPVKATLSIPAGDRCVSETISCSPPDNCGSCQVDLDGFGIRRWENLGCVPTPKPTKPPVPTATAKPAPSLTPTAIPTPTSTPMPTSTPQPTPTNTPTLTPMPTATLTPTPEPTNTPVPTSTPGPTSTPEPTRVLGISAPETLPKTGFGAEPFLVIGLVGVALKIISRMM